MDDQYIALIIDWQGACYDLLSGDLVMIENEYQGWIL
jgi:hypothetical protein